MSGRRRTLSFVAAATAAAAVLAQAAAAANGPPAGQGGLDVRVVSSAPELISGGDARVEIAVPDGIAYSDVEATLNGVDVAPAFAQDPEGGHQLEGVLTGLPLGTSTLAVRIPGPGNARPNRVELELVNHPIQGPMFSGPQQAVFLCATAGSPPRTAGLGPILDPTTCATDRVVGFVYRSVGGSRCVAVVRPGCASTGVCHRDYDDARRRHGSAGRPLGAGRDQSLHLLDRDTLARVAGRRHAGSVGLERRADPEAPGRSRHRPLPGRTPSGARCSTLPGLPLGHAIVYSTGTRTGTHYNLQLGGETAIMVKDRFVSAYAEPEYTVGVGGSGGAIQQYVYGQNHPGLLDAGDSAVLVPGHGHADDPRWRLRAARALAGPSRASQTRPRCGARGRTGG